jgi:hypothetical protein
MRRAPIVLDGCYMNSCGEPRLVLAALDAADLRARIQLFDADLTALRQQLRDQERAVFLLAILELLDGWFEASELTALVPLSPTLSAHLAGKSVKSVGRLLRAIVVDQDRAASLPTLRLLRHKTTTAATVWKIET